MRWQTSHRSSGFWVNLKISSYGRAWPWQLDLGISITAGVINSNGKTLKNLRNENYGRPIFRATMYRFMAISTGLRLDSAEVRVERRQRYKLAPVRKVWENIFPWWQLHSWWAIGSIWRKKQHIISKPTKYNLKIWALCESSSIYASYTEVSCIRKGTIQLEKN